jgi:hypothetical protein
MKKFKRDAEMRTFSENMFGGKKSQNSPDLAFFEASPPPNFRDVHSSRFLFEDIWKFGADSNVQTTRLEALAAGQPSYKFEGNLSQTPISF